MVVRGGRGSLLVGGREDGSGGARRQVSVGDADVVGGGLVGWKELGVLGRDSKGVQAEMGRWTADEAGEE